MLGLGPKGLVAACRRPGVATSAEAALVQPACRLATRARPFPALRIEPPPADKQGHSAFSGTELQTAADRVRGACQHAAAHCREAVRQNRDLGGIRRYHHGKVQRDLRHRLRRHGDDGGALRDRRNGEPVSGHLRHGHIGVACGGGVVEAGVGQHVRQVDLHRRAAHLETDRALAERHAGAAVHLVRALVRERQPAPHRVAGQVRGRAAGERFALHGHAVGVEVSESDGVAEGEGAPVLGRAREVGLADCLADGERELQAGRPGDFHGFVEDHVQVDCLGGLVGVAGGWAGRDGYGGGRDHAVHLVVALRLQHGQGARRRVAHGVRDRPALQGVRRRAHAILVQVAVLHGVAEHQRVRAAAVGKRGFAAGGADAQRDGRVASRLHLIVERDPQFDHLADPVGVAALRRGRDGGGGADGGCHAVH